MDGYSWGRHKRFCESCADGREGHLFQRANTYALRMTNRIMFTTGM
jgi:hypothetical protein